MASAWMGSKKGVGNSLGGEETGKWVLFLKGGNRLRKRGIEMSWDIMTLNWALLLDDKNSRDNWKDVFGEN